MTPQKWHRIRDLLGAALEVPQGERGKYLDEFCPDPATRLEIESLIASAEGVDTFLDQPVFDREFDIPPGQMIGKYRVVEQLAKGGMGAVYRGWDTILDRDVALKVLPAAFASAQTEHDKLTQEARAASSLNHPNIVTFYEILRYCGSPVVAMEFVAGESLERRLRSQSLPLAAAIDIAKQIAAGLARAGVAGLVHRDLKPGNILIRQDGLVKIVDFGLAKRIAAGPDQPDQGAVAGTAGYISPEQALGKALDQRSDVFCFGIVLYELVTGRRAFPGNTLAESLASVLRDEPEPARRISRKLPGALDRLLRSCLEKDVEKRPSSMQDVETALRSISLEGPARRWWPLAVASVSVLGALLLANWRPVEKAPAFSVKRIPQEVADRRFPQIAPDGRSIVYAQKDDTEWHIYRQALDEEGRGGTDLSRACGIGGTHPAWSPDGQWIYFRSEDLGQGLFVMKADGSGLHKVASEGFHPAVSPDGRTLVYSTEAFDRPEERATTLSQLRILDLSSGTVTDLTGPKNVKDAIQPRYSPDGSRVAFWGIDSGGRRQVWTVAATGPSAGRDPVIAVPDGKMDWDPVWARDGHLYFASTRGGSPNLWRTRLDARTGEPQSEAEPVVLPADYGGYFSFSSDGSRMSYLHLQPTSVVCRLRLDGASNGYSRISPLSRRVRLPNVSPDGEWVAAHVQEENEDLVVFRPDGTDFHLLTHDPHRDRDPSWTPDGRTITFGSNRGGDYQLWSVAADGSGMHQLLHHPDGAFCPVWSPDGKRMAWFSRKFRPQLTEGGTSSALPVPGPGLGFRPTSWAADNDRLLGAVRRIGFDGETLAILHVNRKHYEHLPVKGRTAMWLSSGNEIIYTTPQAFYRYTLATRRATPLLEGVSGIAPEFSIAPDEKSLYFTLQRSTAEVWMAERRPAR